MFSIVIPTTYSFLWQNALILFGKLWMKLGGMTDKQIKDAKAKRMFGTLIVAFIAQLVMMYVLTLFVELFGATSFASGLLAGFWVWLGFVATILLGSVLWERKPVQLYLLNAAHWLVVLAIGGAIIAVM